MEGKNIILLILPDQVSEAQTTPISSKFSKSKRCLSDSNSPYVINMRGCKKFCQGEVGPALTTFLHRERVGLVCFLRGGPNQYSKESPV